MKSCEVRKKAPGRGLRLLRSVRQGNVDFRSCVTIRTLSSPQTILLFALPPGSFRRSVWRKRRWKRGLQAVTCWRVSIGKEGRISQLCVTVSRFLILILLSQTEPKHQHRFTPAIKRSYCKFHLVRYSPDVHTATVVPLGYFTSSPTGAYLASRHVEM
jgi:hypothetical protein